MPRATRRAFQIVSFQIHPPQPHQAGGGQAVFGLQIALGAAVVLPDGAQDVYKRQGLSTAQVAEMVSPSVVVITTEQVVYSQWSWYGDVYKRQVRCCAVP